MAGPAFLAVVGIGNLAIRSKAVLGVQAPEDAARRAANVPAWLIVSEHLLRSQAAADLPSFSLCLQTHKGSFDSMPDSPIILPPHPPAGLSPQPIGSSRLPPVALRAALSPEGARALEEGESGRPTSRAPQAALHGLGVRRPQHGTLHGHVRERHLVGVAAERCSFLHGG